MKKEIIILFLANVGSAIGYSLIAPLFPLVAIQKGLTESMIGFIIASFAISNSIITPLGNNIFKLYGKRNILFLALFTEVINNNIFYLSIFKKGTMYFFIRFHS